MTLSWPSQLLTSACLVLALSTSPALAAGGGGGGGGGDGGQSGRVASDPDYKAGMAAVNAAQRDKAIPPLNAYLARKPDDADAWNELAHAYRKSGDLANAFKGFARALQIDPKHRNAHEYLGEAYLQAGDLARAEAELRTLDSLCFLPCEQHKDLKEEIRRYKADHRVASR
jgi:tetratricopeptide (TPR) repeat protein